MELLEAIYSRRAVREFTSAPVEDSQLQSLVDAAVQAPSAINQQPWSFCVVRNQALLTQISNKAKAHFLRSFPAGPVAHHLEEHHLEDMLSDEAFHIFYHAPAMILISATGDGPWMRTDCTLAAQNLMLAAHGAGLGTCWIGFAQGWLETAEGKKTLGLPSAHVPVAPLIVGHPKGATQASNRNQPEVRWLN
jgi:nitroreductase